MMSCALDNRHNGSYYLLIIIAEMFSTCIRSQVQLSWGQVVHRHNRFTMTSIGSLGMINFFWSANRKGFSFEIVNLCKKLFLFFRIDEFIWTIEDLAQTSPSRNLLGRARFLAVV